jgi:hypothetical protein
MVLIQAKLCTKHTKCYPRMQDITDGCKTLWIWEFPILFIPHWSFCFYLGKSSKDSLSEGPISLSTRTGQDRISHMNERHRCRQNITEVIKIWQLHANSGVKHRKYHSCMQNFSDVCKTSLIFAKTLSRYCKMESDAK